MESRFKQFACNHVAVPVATAGVVIGAAAWLLKWLVAAISRLVTSGLTPETCNWWLIGCGTAGIMLTVILVHFVIRQPLEHATDRLKKMVAAGNGSISARIMFAPVLASSLTLGFGGSAGSEGPIAYTGAAIGSNIGRLCGLDRRQMVMAMACGAGAGIAAIFKAPVGGMFFTIEVLRMELGLKPLLMLAPMCIISALTAYILSGDTPDLHLLTHPEFHGGDLWRLVLLGGLCGLYSAFYLKTGHMVARRLGDLSNIWVRALMSGGLLGVFLFLFPALYGEGYDVLAKVANGHLNEVLTGSAFTLVHSDRAMLLPLTLAGLLALKGMAASTTNSGGGVAGEFAPTLFAGGMAGVLFGLLSGMEMPLAVVSGMGAVMAGATRAPLMAIFLTVEMTSQQQMLLPVAICAAISYSISRQFRV